MADSIARVEAVPFRLQSTRPVRFANGTVEHAEHVLVRVTTKDGVVGIAEASPRSMTYGESPASVVHALNAWFGPAAIGLDPFATEKLDAKLINYVGNHTARAALDLAVWDLRGKIADVSCSRLLGGYADRVRVSHMLGFGAPDEVAAEAIEMRENHGIDAFKIKTGREVGVDVATCAAVRKALGASAFLYLDANHGWTADDAWRAVRRIIAADPDIRWVEEPCPAADRIGLAWFQQQCPLLVGGDESCTTLSDTAGMLDRGVQVVAIKTPRTGFTVSQRILGLVAGRGGNVTIGNQLDGSLGSAANLQFAAAHAATCWAPAELAHHLLHADDLLIEPLNVVGGWATVPSGPGLGVAIDEGKLARLRV
jgi:L-alanine-DL-glutamate epimerase-like enolase superfamily enzyme